MTNSLFRGFRRAWQSFSVKQRLVLYAIIGLSVLAIAIFWWQVNERNLIEVPTNGGSLTEGVIGAPRFINPILAITDPDRDMTALVYSGLTRGNTDGVEPDLAEKYEVSPDGLVYTFTLKPDLTWHDGKPLTADDVVFTIERAQDPLLKSPRRAAWEGVRVEKIDDRTVRFTLRQPYSGFLENTTLGIIPAHVWKGVSAETFSYDALNLNPIGSGPYQISKVARTDGEAIINYFDLAPFKNFALGRAYINHIRIRFYENEDALLAAYRRGEIESLNAIAGNAAKNLITSDTVIATAPLPRVFGIFFNPNQNKIFAYSEVREALNQSINKQAIIDQVLSGFGTAISQPLPPGSIGYNETAATSTELATAKVMLEDKGWKKNTNGIYEKAINKTETLHLAFTLATSDAPELKAVAEAARAAWAKLGVDVTIKVFEKGDLSQDVIRPRKYDAVLFGEVTGRHPDPYVFWHSSQRFDPGLNIAMYASVATDKILEAIRTEGDGAKLLDLYRQVNQNIAHDSPAIFLYSPSFIYLIPKTIHHVNLLPITIPADRFATIATWYIATDKVWKIFN